MKKLLLFICAAMMIFSCGKEESGNKPSIGHEDGSGGKPCVLRIDFL